MEITLNLVFDHNVQAVQQVDGFGQGEPGLVECVFGGVDLIVGSPTKFASVRSQWLNRVISRSASEKSALVRSAPSKSRCRAMQRTKFTSLRFSPMKTEWSSRQSKKSNGLTFSRLCLAQSARHQLIPSSRDFLKDTLVNRVYGNLARDRSQSINVQSENNVFWNTISGRLHLVKVHP